MRGRVRAALIGGLLAACTSSPPASDLDVRVRLEISGAGVVQAATAEFVPRGGIFVEDQPDGALTMRVLDESGAASVERTRRFSTTLIDEEFGPTGIIGTEVVGDPSVAYLSFADDGRDEIPLEVTVDLRDGSAPVTSTISVLLERGDEGAASSGLVEISDDVAGRREAICVGFADTCDEPEEFCSGLVCKEEACVPDDTWTNEVTNVRSGGEMSILVVGQQFGSPTGLVSRVRSMLNNMYSRVEWFADHGDAIQWDVWEADCHYGGAEPDLGGGGARDILDWFRGGGDWDGLREWSVQIPDGGYDRILVLGDGDGCRGIAETGGTHLALTGCAGDLDHLADDLAHELGHSIASLSDEYDPAADDDECADDDSLFNRPNVAPADDPSWFCAADTGEVYAGQPCGTNSYGVVGAFRAPIRGCSNDVTRPCQNSIMGSNWNAQFDPVGYGAMEYSLENGFDVMGYDDCDAGCDASCSWVPAGACLLNDCFQPCDRCAAGEVCRADGGDDFSCWEGCTGSGEPCFSGLGREICDGEEFIDGDPSCPSEVAFAMCNNGVIERGMCVPGV